MRDSPETSVSTQITGGRKRSKSIDFRIAKCQPSASIDRNVGARPLKCSAITSFTFKSGSLRTSLIEILPRVTLTWCSASVLSKVLHDGSLIT